MPRMINYRCPHCGTSLQCRRSSIGSPVRCKACGGKILLDQKLLRNGCGCGSVTVVIAAIGVFLLWNGRSGDKSGKEPSQSTGSGAVSPVQSTGSGAVSLVPRASEHEEQNDATTSPKEVEQADEASVNEPDAKSPEIAAEEELRLAELLIGNNRVNPARRRMRELIEKYPGTAAAGKAQKRLESLAERR